MFEVGSLAPDAPFLLAEGKPTRVNAYLGKPLVLYFYPKDDTSGCTKEALEFSALADDFAAVGTVVLGISKDTAKKHQAFAAKYDLRVLLGSDESGAVCEAFGVWVEKSMYGKKYMGIERSTFLINADGTIARIWRKVKVAGHAAEVLAEVQRIA